MPDSYQYDAFISYRHLPLDSAVAERVQKLLENFKAPIKSEDGKRMRINRIFRDRTELPTSGNLDDSLKQALLASRFLIVVLSKETKNSKWCMEEIRLFKQANNGSISHIIPILIEGEPDEVIPDILRTEKREKLLDDGSTGLCEVEVEPLCCDIRSDSLKGSLKLLKTEYLRICASILGVGFDDLYRRHRRRKKKIAITTACIALALLICISAVISIFAFQTYTAQKQRKVKLIESYTQQGATMMEKGDYEKALAYYNSVLDLDSENQFAKTGSLILLQQCGWLNNESESRGYITQNVLYNAKLKALAVDPTGKKFLRETTENIFVSDENNKELENLNEFGSFISCAKDGSCWSFVNDSKITFYFPDDSSFYQVDKPTAINPHCSNNDIETDASLSTPSMAFGKKRAAVCFGGYLYLYNFNSEKNTTSLFETIDLSLVFEKLAEKDSMTRNFYMWADPNGKYCVVSDGNSAAVFDVSDDKKIYFCGFHETYWRTLNNVSFSEDKKHYALVYGNATGINENPGGCVEVYDSEGKQCFATKFDNNIPLSDAVFKPNSNLIAVWGKGELQIWDWSLQCSAATPIQIPDIASALWIKDDKIAVSDNKGTIKYYSISIFERAESDVKLKEYSKTDCRVTSVKLKSGYTVKNGITGLIVSDSNNKTTDEMPLDNTIANHMLADDKTDTVYLWSTFDSFIISATVDKNGKIISSSQLDTQGKNPVKLYNVTNGAIAEMGSGELLYYRNKETDPNIIKPGINGSLTCIASDKSGLMGFVVRSQSEIEGISYTYVYSAELWDLNSCVKLAEYEPSKSEITSLTFSSDRFAFEKNGEKTVLLVDAPTPDRKARKTLKKISCYNIGDNGKASIVNPSFNLEALGNWEEYFTAADKAEEKEETELSFTSQMRSILDEKGEKVWIEEYNKRWKSDEFKNLDKSILCDIAKDYYLNAIKYDLTKEAEIGINKFFEIISSDEAPDLYTINKLDFLAFETAAYTPEYKDSVKSYFKKLAEYYEASYKITEDDAEDDTESNKRNYILTSAYSYRLITRLLDGKGAKAFDIKNSTIDKVYSEKKDELINQDIFKVYSYLFNGNTKAAAVQYDKALEVSSSASYTLLTIELQAYVRAGSLSEKDYSDFFHSLRYPTGTKLTRVTVSQLEAGLKPGDTVVAVNGIYFGNPNYLYTGEKTVPKKVTFIHNEKTSTVKAESDWVFTGDFPT